MKKPGRNSFGESISLDQEKELKLIGLAIRELRFNFGLLTQKELAEQCNVHYNTIQAIEHGDRSYNLKSLLKIIRYFDYDLTTFSRELL
jgi:transcriptional regulator with XRE-family HTH domain